MDKELDLTNLKFDRSNDTASYSRNKPSNKKASALSTPKIISGLFQLEENIHKCFEQLNAYDSSSIIIAESNWIKRNHFNKYMPSKECKTKNIKIGMVCMIDYGKTYKGEIGYIHPGLCVGKKENKYLIIPITTGTQWRTSCYHPLKNPKQTKEKRQALETEGFAKDEVLLMNDAKYISGGRILEVRESINDDALAEIQMHLFQIMFPSIALDMKKYKKEIDELSSQNTKFKNICTNMESQIKNLKSKNTALTEKLQKNNSQNNKKSF